MPAKSGSPAQNSLHGQSGEMEGLVALVMGDIHSAPPMVRIHSQCLTGDVFGSLRCDCRLQLELALSRIAQEGAGILLYEQQEGRGIGLMAKLKAYELQDAGLDTAVSTSVKAVLANPGPMAIWGLTVAGGLVLGSLPAFIGLVVVIPVLGHATWHLYRKLVQTR